MVVHWLRLSAPNAGGPSSVPEEGTRSHKPPLKIPLATPKTWHSIINNKINILKIVVVFDKNFCVVTKYLLAHFVNN